MNINAINAYMLATKHSCMIYTFKHDRNYLKSLIMKSYETLSTQNSSIKHLTVPKQETKYYIQILITTMTLVFLMLDFKKCLEMKCISHAISRTVEEKRRAAYIKACKEYKRDPSYDIVSHIKEVCRLKKKAQELGYQVSEFEAIDHLINSMPGHLGDVAKRAKAEVLMVEDPNWITFDYFSGTLKYRWNDFKVTQEIKSESSSPQVQVSPQLGTYNGHPILGLSHSCLFYLIKCFLLFHVLMNDVLTNLWNATSFII